MELHSKPPSRDETDQNRKEPAPSQQSKTSERSSNHHHRLFEHEALKKMVRDKADEMFGIIKSQQGPKIYMRQNFGIK